MQGAETGSAKLRFAQRGRPAGPQVLRAGARFPSRTPIRGIPIPPPPFGAGAGAGARIPSRTPTRGIPIPPPPCRNGFRAVRVPERILAPPARAALQTCPLPPFGRIAPNPPTRYSPTRRGGLPAEARSPHLWQDRPEDRRARLRNLARQRPAHVAPGCALATETAGPAGVRRPVDALCQRGSYADPHRIGLRNPSPTWGRGQGKGVTLGVLGLPDTNVGSAQQPDTAVVTMATMPVTRAPYTALQALLPLLCAPI